MAETIRGKYPEYGRQKMRAFRAQLDKTFDELIKAAQNMQQEGEQDDDNEVMTISSDDSDSGKKSKNNQNNDKGMDI